MSDSREDPSCWRCQATMRREWTPPQVSVPQGGGYFNHGLGIPVRHKSDVQDEIKRLRDGGTRMAPRVDPDTGRSYRERVDVPGREIEEVGNEKLANQRTPKRSSYDLTPEQERRLGI